MSNDVIRALQLLKEKQWVDLTHTFDPDSPHFSAFADAQFTTLFQHDDGFFAQSFTFPGQYGTHLDAPIHFVRNTRYLEELDLKELVLPLVVIDKSKEAEANHDFALGVEDVLQFEAEHGLIEEGSFVALRTDWSKRWLETRLPLITKTRTVTAMRRDGRSPLLSFCSRNAKSKRSGMKRSIRTQASITKKTAPCWPNTTYSNKTPIKSN